MISIVCPFYNEQIILAKAIECMLANLSRLAEPWELVIVNDGSIDNSLSIAQALAECEPRLRVVSYVKNHGRGYALRKGIEAAQGEIIITTEIDCSWGEDIVTKLVAALRANPALDIVIASTNLPGGSYANVPLLRVKLSRMGNMLLRLTLSNQISMFTGMTRGYRATAIKSLPISEMGKEFHLDVIVKALALGLRIGEIPVTLTWQNDKLAQDGAPKRKSSSKLKRIIGTHLLFALSGRPFRYLFVLSAMVFALSLIFLLWGIIHLIIGAVSVYLLILALSCFILFVLLGGISVLALQQNAILRELWITRQEIKAAQETLIRP